MIELDELESDFIISRKIEIDRKLNDIAELVPPEFLTVAGQRTADLTKYFFRLGREFEASL